MLTKYCIQSAEKERIRKRAQGEKMIQNNVVENKFEIQTSIDYTNYSQSCLPIAESSSLAT